MRPKGPEPTYELSAVILLFWGLVGAVIGIVVVNTVLWFNGPTYKIQSCEGMGGTYSLLEEECKVQNKGGTTVYEWEEGSKGQPGPVGLPGKDI